MVHSNRDFPHREGDPLALLKDGAAALGLVLSPAALEQFRLYLQELQTWNARVNLTGLKSPRDLIIKGFLDSLAILPFLGETPSLADLGSGAGFPGLVVKLARPEMALTLVEARVKKAAFLHYVVALWQLPEVEVVQAQLTPKLAQKWGPRFAAVTSRATFPLVDFLKLAAPLLRPGGKALALKGPQLPPVELEAAQKRLAALDLQDLEIHDYRLPPDDEPRLVAVAYKKR